MQDQNCFEQVLTEFSSRFVHLLPEQVDTEIESAMQRICEVLAIDRCQLAKYEESTVGFHLTHRWAAPGIDLLPEIIPHEHIPWITNTLMGGEMVQFSCLADFPAEAKKDMESARDLVKAKSGTILPLCAGGKVFGAIAFDAVLEERNWSVQDTKRLQLVAQVFSNTLARKKYDEHLQRAWSEIKRLKEQLEGENLYLREEIKLEHQHHEVIGQSEGIRRVLRSAEQVALTDSTVLLQGETGTGKELIARAIHSFSRRKDRPMVKVNCAALPATLVESELFGREKGAFTGALTREMGRFELAHGSTIFLDEIGELPLELQAKLLRVLQEGEFERLGSSKTIKVDVRVIVATARDLKAMARDGKFREDLFYRVSVFPIHIPPLRERREDIPMLVWHFVREIGRRMGRNVEDVRSSTMKSFQNYSWPGNVRELRNVIERHLITNAGPIFQADLSGMDFPQAELKRTMVAVEQAHISQVLKATSGKIRGAGGAAEILGMNPSTLESRMKKLGLSRLQ
jgi:transcriptional regulator with GAF, ATPase, and Fis domain